MAVAGLGDGAEPAVAAGGVLGGDQAEVGADAVAGEAMPVADLDRERERYVFIGDSPNDAPMFAYFPYAVGVANVRDFGAQLSHEPAYVTDKRCGAGFRECVDFLLAPG